MNEGSMILKNARLVDGSIVDLRIENGLIAEIGTALSKAGTLIDVEKNLLIPGLVDLHTHLREPGREDSETVATAGAAAVTGG
jgi:dihydroorotase